MSNLENMKSEVLMYKNRPLVRSGDTLYYGYLFENIVAKIDIKASEMVDGESVATSVNVTLMNSDPSVPPSKMVISTANRDSLYKAIDLAEFWVSKELEKKQ